MNNAETLRPGDVGDWRDMLSVDPEGLYGKGGFFDSDVTIAHLQDVARTHAGAVDILAELFPAASVSRPMPAFVDGPDEAFLREVIAGCQGLNSIFATIAASKLVRIPKAAIYDNIVFAVCDGVPVPIYEMLRTPDRPVKGQAAAARACAAGEGLRLDGDGASLLFQGSVGSFNYGHWLVDDLPTAKAIEFLDPNHRVTVVMSSYGHKMDAVRAEGTLLASTRADGVTSTFLPTDRLFLVDDLHYVSPVSYHPILKHPQALAHAVATCAPRSTVARAPSRRLFVNRAADSPRRIVNAAEVRGVLARYGFEEVLPETMSFTEQREAFRDASHVVGVMGAAMTNTLFCAPDSHVLQLAPSGWSEPFYWDLAAMLGQRYAALFGTAEPPFEHIHQCPFTVDVDKLWTWLESSASQF